jgi:uncharacterized membrane protein YkoI
MIKLWREQLRLVKFNQQRQPTKKMKTTSIICTVLAAGFFAGCSTESQSKLQSEAKVSKTDAQATALARVPNGTCKESELEREHGKLIWSFDIATPDTKDVTEVNVNAISGDVVNIEREKDGD